MAEYNSVWRRNMIPKIIHYVWLGGNEKPDLVLMCIESWKRYLPDYQIIEWNDENTKHIDSRYMREAIEQKKWAFASDYVRLWALYHYGGVYLDTDVEMRKCLDEFLHLRFFSGFEKNFSVAPITALMGSEINNVLMKELLSLYDNRRFIINGNIDNTTNVVAITKYFCAKYNLSDRFDENTLLELEDGISIYPHFYFCTDNINAYSVHHYNASWMSSWYKRFEVKLFNFKLCLYKRTWLERETLPDILQGEKLIYSKAATLLFLTKKSFIKRKKILFCILKCIKNN